MGSRVNFKSEIDSFFLRSCLTMMKAMLVLSLFCLPVLPKCTVDKEVKFILKNMNPSSVQREVDCVVGIGACDNLGVRLKAEAPRAVRQGRCGRNAPASKFRCG